MNLCNEDMRGHQQGESLICREGCKKSSGRPNITWREILRNDMDKLKKNIRASLK